MACISTLQWRHNERDGFSNHRRFNCLLNRLFGLGSKKTPKLRVTGLCEWNPSVTGGSPHKGANNAENVSIWWRYRDVSCRPGGDCNVKILFYQYRLSSHYKNKTVVRQSYFYDGESFTSKDGLNIENNQLCRGFSLSLIGPNDV